MRVLNADKLDEFATQHPTSRQTIAKWIDRIQAVEATNLLELRQAFAKSVDLIEGTTYCFNLGGNKARIIAVVIFIEGDVIIENVFTHVEYDRWSKTRKKG